MIELVALPMLGVGGESAQAAPITAAIYFWFFLPWMVITPIGGWLADTLPRKWIMLACDEGRAGLLLIAAIMVPAGITAEGFSHIPIHELHQAWKVYAVLGGVGLFAAIFGPTRNAMIPQIVTPNQLNPANSVILGIGVIASLIGYIIGGWLIGSYSVRTGIIVALLCLAAVTGTFWGFIRPRPHTGLELDRELGEWTRMARAVQYIRRHGVVLRLVLLNALLWSIAMIVALTIAALCKHAYLIQEDYMKWFAIMSGTLSGRGCCWRSRVPAPGSTCGGGGFRAPEDDRGHGGDPRAAGGQPVVRRGPGAHPRRRVLRRRGDDPGFVYHTISDA